MARKKVKLEFIANNSVRRATFRKRKRNIMKKLDELTTLCGVEACAIVYDPYGHGPQPAEVWPSPSGVQNVLNKFRLMPQYDQTRSKMSQESFLYQRIAKAKEQLHRQKHGNKEKEMALVMFQCLGVGGEAPIMNMSKDDLNDFKWVIERNLRDINKRMQEYDHHGDDNNMNAQMMMTDQNVQAPMVVAPVPSTTQEVGMANNNQENVHDDQWLVEKTQNILAPVEMNFVGLMDLINGLGD